MTSGLPPDKTGFWGAPVRPEHGIWDDGRFVSYAQVWARGDALVASARVGRDKCLALLFVDNSAASVAAYLGFLRAGHAVALAERTWSVAAQRALIERYRPEIVYWSDTGQSGWPPAALPGLERRASDGGALFASTPDSAASAEGDPLHPELALLLATSGSTGEPKLVRLSHRAVQENAQAIAEYLAIDADERAVTSLPMSYAFGLSVVNSHVHAGASLVCTRLRFRDIGFWDLIERRSCTSLAGVPVQYAQLRDMGYWQSPRPSVRTYTQAGGGLAPALQAYHREQAHQWGARFYVMYGQTEATARMAYVPPDELPTHLGTIGVAIPGGRLSIREPDPATGAGELFYEGPNVMMGYAHGRACLSAGDELGGALATGDIATMDGDGYFRLVGRYKRMVKLLGERISLERLELVLSQRGARRVAVVAADGDDRPVVGFVEGDRLPDGLLAGNLRTIEEQLGLPAGYIELVAIDRIPRTERHKPDYQALSALWRQQPGSRGVGANASFGTAAVSVQPTIGRIWAKVLQLSKGPDSIGLHDSFFVMGGDSLLAMQALYELRRCGLDCDIGALFAHPTVAGLATALSEREQTPLDPAEQSAEKRSAPVQFARRFEEGSLSANQRMYLSFHRWSRGAPTYNIPVLVELRGPLDVSALRAAIDELVARHDILRTRYGFEAGRLRALVAPSAPMPLDITTCDRDREGDWASFDEPLAWARPVAEREANGRLDLASGPVIRFSLVRRTAEHHALVIVLYHIAGDGWSRELMLDELAALYSAHIDSADDSAAATALPPPIQYADVMARSARSDAVKERARVTFWRDLLADGPARLQLTQDGPRPGRPSERGHVVRFVLDRDAVARLQQVARYSRATVYMVLLGAFHAFLWRRSGQTDITIGSPHAGARHGGAERMMGCLATPLIMRLKFRPERSFTDFLATVRRATLAAVTHAPVPYERLSGTRGRVVGYAEWFQALFVLVNVRRSKLDFVGLQTRQRLLASATAKCDLNLFCEDHGDWLDGAFSCRTDLFSEARARALLAEFLSFLEALCAHSDQPIRDVSTGLTPAHSHRRR